MAATKKVTTKAKANGKGDYPPFTSALVDRILKMNADGLSKQAIADAIGGGYPVHRVWKILALAGRTQTQAKDMKRAAAGGLADVMPKARPVKKATAKKATRTKQPASA